MGATYCSFIPSRNAITWDWRPRNQTVLKSLLQFSLGMQIKILVTKKLKIRKSNILPICHDAPTWAIASNFGSCGDIANVNDNPCQILWQLVRDFGVLIPPTYGLSAGVQNRLDPARKEQTYIYNNWYNWNTNTHTKLQKITPVAENGTRCGYESLRNRLLIRVDFPSPDSPTQVYCKHSTFN